MDQSVITDLLGTRMATRLISNATLPSLLYLL